MKATFNRAQLSLIIELLLVSCIFWAAWNAFHEVKAVGWSSDAWEFLLLGGALTITAGLTFLQLLQERTRFDRLVAEHPHIVNIHPNGKVVLAGHRISLYQIMKDLHSLQGANDVVGQLRELYPTVDAGLLQQVVDFCEQNSHQLRGYFTQQQKLEKKMGRKIESCRAGFTLEELRKRRDEGLSSNQGTF